MDQFVKGNRSKLDLETIGGRQNVGGLRADVDIRRFDIVGHF